MEFSPISSPNRLSSTVSYNRNWWNRNIVQLVVWFWKTFRKPQGQCKSIQCNRTVNIYYIDAVKCWKSKFRGMSFKWTIQIIFAVNNFIDIFRRGRVDSKVQTMFMLETMQLKRKYLLLWNGSCSLVIWCLLKPNHSLTHFKAWRHGHSCLLSIVSSHHRCGFFLMLNHKIGQFDFRKTGARKAYAQMGCTMSLLLMLLQPKIYDPRNRMQFFLFFFKTFLVVFASNRIESSVFGSFVKR